jgi:hypothetical protein
VGDETQAGAGVESRRRLPGPRAARRLMNAPRTARSRLGAARDAATREDGGRAGEGDGALQTPSRARGRGLLGTRLPLLMPAGSAPLAAGEGTRRRRRGVGKARRPQRWRGSPGAVTGGSEARRTERTLPRREDWRAGGW